MGKCGIIREVVGSFGRKRRCFQPHRSPVESPGDRDLCVKCLHNTKDARLAISICVSGVYTTRRIQDFGCKTGLPDLMSTNA